jgi:glycolate oxidase iron-sulfur subunit
VLSALGWDVHVPATQGCCGAIARHAGDPDQAQRRAADTAGAFAVAGVEHIVVLDSGCVESLRYGAGPAPVVELLQFVAGDSRLDQLGLLKLPGPLALHLPCTQRNVTFGVAAAHTLLQRLGTEPVLLGGRGCCGAAGSQVLVDPGRAATFREPLLDAFAAAGAATLASGNVGCRMHLQAGLRDRPATATARVVHPIELLADHLP